MLNRVKAPGGKYLKSSYMIIKTKTLTHVKPATSEAGVAQGAVKRTVCSSRMLCLILVGSCNKANISGLLVGLSAWADDERNGHFLLPQHRWSQLLGRSLHYPSLVTPSSFPPFRFLRKKVHDCLFFLSLIHWTSQPSHPNTFFHLQLHPCPCDRFPWMSKPSCPSSLFAGLLCTMHLALLRGNGTCIFPGV